MKGRKRVLFATSGHDAQYIVPMDGKEPNGEYDEIHVFHPARRGRAYATPPTLAALDALHHALSPWQQKGGILLFHEFDDVYDFAGNLATMERVLAGLGAGVDVVVNGSNGVAPAIMAATMLARNHDLELVYYGVMEQRGRMVFSGKAGKKTLSDLLAKGPKRELVKALTDGPLSLTEIQTKLGKTLPTVWQHVEELQKAGVLASRRDGKARLVELDPARKAEVRALLRNT